MSDPAAQGEASKLTFLNGGGAIGALARTLDWSVTPVGAPDRWPDPLRTLLAVILASGQPMFILWGPQRTFFYNDAFIPIAGRKHPAALGRPAQDVWSEAWAELGPRYDKVFAGEPSHVTGFTLGLDRSGTIEEAHFDFSYTPVQGDDGAIDGLFGVCVETTDRVLGERQQLAAAERERIRIFEMSRDLFAIATFDGYLKSINPAWSRQLGRPEAELLTRPFADIIHPEDLAATGEVLATLQPGEPVHQFHVRLLKADGSALSIAWSAVPEAATGGGCFYTVGRDVTGEVAAADERNLLTKLIETTDTMMMAVDLGYKILAINSANADEFERIYGVRPKAGDNMLGLLADQPEHQEQVRLGWGRGLAGEEVTFIEPYGDPLRVRPYYEVKFRTLRNEAGERIGCYQFVADVTERLRDQAKLAQAQEALLQSQKLEAMGQLTGGVAHDFNNLLTPIIASLDMLQRRKIGGDREQRLIHGALQSAERAKTLVQRLLAFARRQPLQATAVDVAALVTGMAGLVASTTGPQIDVVVEVAEALPNAKADPNQLEMAILNLSVNARDAMARGGTLRITARPDVVQPDDGRGMASGDYVVLSVADTGVGMDEPTLARAIEPFFSTKGVGKGTGLGLSMAHGLASQLGGRLNILSRPGFGTTVELWLPVSAEAPPAAASIDPPALPGPAGTALLVDDEEYVRASTADMLVELGFAVQEATSAEHALEILGEGLRVDLLVTDHLMPGMTGVELAQVFRYTRPATPVLIVSGFAEAEGIDSSLPRLTKPFRQNDLARIVSQLMVEGGASSR